MKLLQIMTVAMLVVSGCGQAEEPADAVEDNSSVQNTIPIDNNYGHKIVYSTDAGIDTTPLQQDCQSRGGEFMECGSPCADPNGVCITVCAFTCENIPEPAHEPH